MEGELLRVLTESEAIQDPRAARYEAASRTDAGVSATRNVCAFQSPMDPRRIPHVPNDVDGLWLLGAAKAPSGFSPRREAISKRYVYHVLDPQRYDWDRIAKAASLFVGQHDFRNYCRPDRDAPTRRTLSSLVVEDGRLVFEAPNFLWEQVRRITQALLDVGTGAASSEAVRRRLDGPRRADPQRPAPSDGLVLADVLLSIELLAPSKAAANQVRAAAARQRARGRFYEVLEASVPTPRR